MNHLRTWFAMLGLARQSPRSWHRARLAEELRERRLARSRLAALSETADVFFAIHRAHHDGFPLRRLPPAPLPVYTYMVAKYSLRWMFYQTAALLCSGNGHWRSVREVVNPERDHKLDEVATRHRLDPAAFRKVAQSLRRAWPLLP